MKALFAMIALCLAGTVFAQDKPAGPYALPPLAYSVEALEPAIDRKTMSIHHQRHHGAQVNALNLLVATVPELKTGEIESLLASVSRLPAGVRNNLGGHFNHSLFWQVMAPKGSGGAPSKALSKAIVTAFGSHDEMKKQFSAAASTRFGSGWAWLVVTSEGKLAVTSTPNQDNPMMDVAEIRGAPILALDVWEHAYYLKYQNLRGDYIAAWWEVVNWKAVSERYEKVLKAQKVAAKK